MDICNWDTRKVFDNKHEDLDFIGSFPVEMYKDLDFGGFVEINGKVYRMCSYSIEKDILTVEKVDHFEFSPEAITASDHTCPYCKAIDYDAWELHDDEGECYCGSCSSDLKYKRHHSIWGGPDYEYFVEPLKMSDYTKLS